MNIEQLEKLLVEHRIPIDSWGRGEAKKVEHLLKEVNAGEAVFRFVNGFLVRCIKVAAIYVYYPLSDQTLHFLRETRQVFNDGRVRKIRRDTSVSEKLMPGEKPEEAAHRALAEELNDDFRKGGYSMAAIGCDPVITGGTRSYPHLRTFRQRYFFVCVVPKFLYRHEGYKEVQAGVKTIYFDWVPIHRYDAQPFMYAVMGGMKLPR
ncbi:hypothetical protein KGQ27_03135 [Patescibacteria group bacterium]|nr:hypothetical protein [Patescibacteria group bacterium]MDE1946740.1 hypothetical protein [Patescibacteria group bacterium]MDE2010957.1 hypothetical protein [Patescibacteria group bacterium]MDE2232799.1 hypothetical protein [Patescibacteria group bacterium]